MKGKEQWIAQALEGELGKAELAELVQYLEEDPALLAELSEQASIHGWLGLALEDEARREQIVAETMNVIKKLDGEAFVKEVSRKIVSIQIRRRVIWAAAAAAVMIIGLSLWPQVPRSVATIAGIGALNEEATLRAGDRFAQGDQLGFGSGLVELELAGRGRMIVEGPAILTFTGPLSASLIKGRVLLRVTEKGHGYRLETPKGTLVDLGTEFGVFVDEKSGEVETHVLDGEVEAVSRSGAETISLKKKEALRQTQELNIRIPSDQASFYASLPPAHLGNVNMIHWSMDAADGKTIPARIRGFGNKTYDLELRHVAEGGFPQSINGPFGPAINFDGIGSFAQSEFRGIAGARPRTVVFWAKIPRDFQITQGFAMVSWGEFRKNEPGSVWQISVNPLESDGPVGRLRLGVHGGKSIGTTDLRDDQWHHVAVVLYPAVNPDLGQQVLLYIDGFPETISRKILGKIDTVIEEANHGVWLGRDVTSTREHSWRFFRGGIDEVYIFDAALTQKEVRTLMEHNQAPRQLMSSY